MRINTDMDSRSSLPELGCSPPYLKNPAFSFISGISLSSTWRDFSMSVSTKSTAHSQQYLLAFIKAYVLSTILYCVAIMLAKAAIILEWTHIFVARPIRSNFYWICYGMIAANTCLYIATIITINFACNPRERIWRRYLPGSCINIDAFNLFITSFHLIFDLLMLLLPHKVIWGLGLTLKQKIGVSIVFSFGSLYVFFPFLPASKRYSNLSIEP